MWPSGGQAGPGAAGGNGGGGAFFYQGGELLVVCGGGGGGSLTPGSAGQGQPGFGGGVGPSNYATPTEGSTTLTSIGQFPGGLPNANSTEPDGGRVGRCTIGNYWANQGIAPCVSIGSTTFFTGQNGQKSTSIFTTPVIRGYKAGLNYQFNAGNGQFNGDGGGGGGARGGDGGRGTSGLGEGGHGGLGFAAIPIDSATVGGHVGMVGTIKIEKA